MLQKIKSAYLLWFTFYPTINKIHRYTLAQRIDSIFITVIELVAAACYATLPEKLPLIRLAIQKLDTLKVLLHILWEVRSIDTKKYVLVSQPLDEVGKMLGGWRGQIEKKTRGA